MPRILVVVLCLFICSRALHAQETDIARYLAEHTYPIDVQENTFTGPGIDKLIEEASQSQFVLLGERHFTHEIPLFIEALLPQLNDLGFATLAVETGPIGAASLVRKIRTGEAVAERAYGVPFYSTEEEISLIETFLGHTSVARPLWGVDQEGLFGLRTAFAEIGEKARTPAQVSLINDLQEKAESAYNAFMESGRYSSLLYFRRADSTLSQLRAAFGNDEDVLDMVDHIARAQAIHRSRDGFFKNTERLRTIKENFLREFMQARLSTGQNPRVIVKMGSNHTQRGLNDQLLSDLGNFLEGFAEALGSQSLHVSLFQLRGRTVFFTPENDRADRLTPRTEAFVYSYPPVLTEIAPQTSWVLYDLRPLRELLWRQHWVEEDEQLDWIASLPQDFRRFVNAHDLVVMIPETGPQTLAPVKK